MSSKHKISESNLKGAKVKCLLTMNYLHKNIKINIIYIAAGQMYCNQINLFFIFPFYHLHAVSY